MSLVSRNWKIETIVAPSCPSGVLCAHQVHGNRIVNATELKTHNADADGILLHASDGAAAIRTADCLPLVITSYAQALLLHVSRKTLIAGLLDLAPNYFDMTSATGVYIGPHICSDHFTFETNGPEIKAFSRKFPFATKEGNELHLSLIDVVENYLAQWGINPSLLKKDNRCTFTDGNLPSWKRQRLIIPLNTHIFTVVKYEKVPGKETGA